MSDEEVEVCQRQDSLFDVERPLDVDGKDIELFLNGHQICVELSKGADGFGLTLEGGADRPLYSKDDGIFITSIRKGSNADKLDCLEVGDKVLEVNSTNLEKMKHADAVELFRSSKKATELSSSRESMDSPSEDPRDLKDFSPVGFVIGIAVGCFVVFAVRSPDNGSAHLVTSTDINLEEELIDSSASLHATSTTRWSAIIEDVKPIASNLPGVLKALDQLGDTSLSAEAMEVWSILLNYFKSFKGLILLTFWYKILVPIHTANLLMETSISTIDEAVKQLDVLIEEIKAIRDNWDAIVNEAKFVAESLEIDSVFESRRKRKRRADNRNESCGLSNEDESKLNVFYVAFDSVLTGISLRCRETRNIASNLSFLWRYVEMEETKLNSAVKEFAANYATDVSPDLLEEMIQLRHLHRLKFGDVCLSPLDLLNKLEVWD
eukprot:gene2697-908_t